MEEFEVGMLVDFRNGFLNYRGMIEWMDDIGAWIIDTHGDKHLVSFNNIIK